MSGICFSSPLSSYDLHNASIPCSLRSPIRHSVFISRSVHSLKVKGPPISYSLNNFDASLQTTGIFSCKPSGYRKLSFETFRHVGCANQESPLVSDAENEEGWMNALHQVGEVLSMAFPAWIALACLAGLVRPSAFLWIRGNWQIAGLTVTMLGMGMTLSLKDLQGALAMPKEILGGVLLQYTVMPTAGALVSRLLNLPSHYAAGLVLVACCPGGTASNVVTYIARGNVALSVLMTAASTFLAVVMTPLLTAKLAGQYVAVDASGLFSSALQVVLLPVLTGALINQYMPTLVRKLSPFTPLVAVLTVSALCASAIAQSASVILSSGGRVVLAVCALHSAGYFFGYLLSKLLGFDSCTSRTISIEVGMQNSVLGVVLAGQHFSNPLSAVPCAVSSVCQSIFGSALAGVWRLTSGNEVKD